MRKFIKKIAAVATTAALVAAMGISAFASDYTYVCDPRLVGNPDKGNTDVGWVPTAEDQILEDAGDGLYAKKFTCAETADLQYKILKDSCDFAWSYQMCIGNPDTAWGDNMTQFQANVAAGDYVVVANPSQGLVVLVQNGKVLDFSVRYNSWDEDPADFVAPTVAAISAMKSGKSGKNFEPTDFEANLEALKTKAVEVAAKYATTTEETTTAAAAETTATNAETTAAKPVKTGDTAPVAVMVTLFAAVAVVAVVAKKKEA